MSDITQNKRRSNYIIVNNWSQKKEKLLKYWQEECRLYTWLYTQNVEYYQKINSRLSIINILLSVVTGATLLNNSSNSDGVNPHLVLAFGLISVVSSFLQGIRQFLDLESKISLNMVTSRQNSAIVIDIEEQLNLSREERINGNEFLKNIKTRKNEIIQNAPIISRSRWTQLKRKIKMGEGINFFNETIFKNYLENTVELVDLKLDTSPDNSEQITTQNSPENITSLDNQMSYSEDELIEELQVDNLSTQQLRSAFASKPPSKQLDSVVATTPSHEGDAIMPPDNPHKLDALLKYHMSRL